ncbi:hypothetical protein CYMTET_15627 [Cymbomonas tetramitiformis]|uniref:Uncharacterized protein n=1 Tax=Cymbomonas tetramitiformis TaxID=36881 RepID=A0AAE0L938_9CHLO|nr:hypothetical protein CYMTET_15627 [Cymbomonas tetramitiformis]
MRLSKILHSSRNVLPATLSVFLATCCLVTSLSVAPNLGSETASAYSGYTKDPEGHVDNVTTTQDMEEFSRRLRAGLFSLEDQGVALLRNIVALFHWPSWYVGTETVQRYRNPPC